MERQYFLEWRLLYISSTCTKIDQGGANFMAHGASPPRVVGTFGTVLLSLNSVIGAGIFALPAVLYAATGNFAPWMFLIFGLLQSFNVLVFARLATMFDASGGVQLYAQTAFGPLTGFLIGWLRILAEAAGRGAGLLVLVDYLAVFFPALADPMAKQLAVLLLMAALCGLTLAGMRNAINSLAIGTIFKLAPIVVLCLLAYVSGGFAVSRTLPSIGEFESVALLASFALTGVASANSAAGEIKDPRRTLPRAMLITLAGTVLFYMAVQWAYIAAGAPSSEGNATPLAAAAAAVMGEAGVVAISIAAIFSIATVSLTSFIQAPRVIFGMAERGLLPPILGHVSRRFKAPDAAIFLFTLIAVVISFSGLFSFLAAVNVLASRLVGLAGAAALIRFQLLLPTSQGGGMTPFWTLVIAIAAAYAVFICLQAPLSAYALLAGLLLIGGLLYRVARGDRVVSPEPSVEPR